MNQEDFEDRPAESLDLARIRGIARRRWLYFLGPFFGAWLVVWLASWIIAPTYKSSTMILVEQPSVPKDYVMPNVSDDLQDRLQSIQQQILSRTRLLHIIDGLNLYGAERSKRTPDDLVERMRKNIDVQLVHDETQRALSSFEVAFFDRDPRTAQKVTTELTNLFISENLETRQQESADTTNFLSSELEEARKSLAEQELKVREFKDKHPGELPTQMESNIQILTGLQSQLQQEQDALNAAKQQNAYLQSLLTQYHTMQKTGEAPGTTNPQLTAVDQELERERAQLIDLKSHYTDSYPDVRKLEDQIGRTEKAKAQIVANIKAQGGGEDGASSGAGQDTSLLQIQGQMKANQLEIGNREKTIAGLQGRVGEYQSHLNQEPVIEQQFTDLTRGYEQSKNNYDDLLKKKNASQMATSMELRQQGEHFRVLDAPNLPLKPDSPNRLKLCGIGLGIGLALGAITVFAAEWLDDRIYDESGIKKLVPVGVLGEIPPLVTAREQQQERKKLQTAWVATAVVTVAILAGSAASYLRG